MANLSYAAKQIYCSSTKNSRQYKQDVNNMLKSINNPQKDMQMLIFEEQMDSMDLSIEEEQEVWEQYLKNIEEVNQGKNIVNMQKWRDENVIINEASGPENYDRR